jgi:CelD/BcsL family acetyltransferase involved in cellulose biosynthesis
MTNAEHLKKLDLSAVQLEKVERLEDIRDDWRRLAVETGHPFATFEWNEAWWRHFGADRSLTVFTCREPSGRVAAILPLYVAATRPVHVARFIGYGDLMSPLCAPGDRGLAAQALLEATRRGGPRLVYAERLPSGDGWGDLVGGRLITAGPDPVLRVDGMTWEDFLASRSRNFRDQTRRRERKLVREQGLSFRLCDEPERVRADMDTLFKLHSARWRGETTGVFEGPGADFHREFAQAALAAGWLRLWLAEIGGEPVAAWYGWRFAGSEWYYQAGRDTRFDRYSLGFVLLAHTVREAIGDGVDAYRFLAGGEEYKWRFAQEDPGAESRLLGTGVAAGAARVAVRVGLSLPAPLRRLLTRSAAS